MAHRTRWLLCAVGIPVAILGLALLSAWFLLPRLAPLWTWDHSPFAGQRLAAMLHGPAPDTGYAERLVDASSEWPEDGTEQHLLAAARSGPFRLRALQILALVPNQHDAGWSEDLRPVLELAIVPGNDATGLRQAARDFLTIRCPPWLYIDRQLRPDGLWCDDATGNALTCLAALLVGLDPHTDDHLVILQETLAGGEPPHDALAAGAWAMAAHLSGFGADTERPEAIPPLALDGWSLDRFALVLAAVVDQQWGRAVAGEPLRAWRAACRRDLTALADAARPAIDRPRHRDHQRSAVLLGTAVLLGLQDDDGSITRLAEGLSSHAVERLAAGDLTAWPAAIAARTWDAEAWCRLPGMREVPSLDPEHLYWGEDPSLLGSVGAPGLAPAERLRQTVLTALVHAFPLDYRATAP